MTRRPADGRMRKEEVPGGTSSFAAGMLYDVPISVVLTALPRVAARESRERDALVVARHVRRRSGGGGRRGGLGGVGGIGLGLDGRSLLCRGLIDLLDQIGRASCRERV